MTSPELTKDPARTVSYRRIGQLAVPLDPRCDICSVVEPSPASDLVDATTSPYPSVSSLEGQYLPAVHNTIVHGGGPVARELGSIAAVARAVAMPVR